MELWYVTVSLCLFLQLGDRDGQYHLLLQNEKFILSALHSMLHFYGTYAITYAHANEGAVHYHI